MNKRLFLVISLLSTCFLHSCLTCLHNLVTYKDVVNDKRITGSWQYGDINMKIEPIPTSFFFKKMTAEKVNGKESKSAYDSKEDSLLYSRSYIVDFVKNNYRYYLACCLTRIGDDLYADMEPLTAEPVNKSTPNDTDNLFSSGTYITTHSIAKVIFNGSELELRILNGDFIEKQMTNGAAAIKYETDDLFSTAIITSSAGELRQFLTKYGNDERLYSSKNTIILKKI